MVMELQLIKQVMFMLRVELNHLPFQQQQELLTPLIMAMLMYL